MAGLTSRGKRSRDSKQNDFLALEFLLSASVSERVDLLGIKVDRDSASSDFTGLGSEGDVFERCGGECISYLQAHGC
jgi:hypothetical protein